ncbi:MAG: flagellar hook assembly protein FlgD, partial [Planctomycetota bacterium]
FVFSLSVLFCPACPAVSSKVTRHSTGAVLAKGQIDDVVVGSQGTIQLGRAVETLAEEFEDVWSINSVVASGGTIFIGTSPNGGIYKYSLGKLTKIYPVTKSAQEGTNPLEAQENKEIKSVSEPNDANAVEIERYLENEHIFAMATDVSGRLLAGISGSKCQLMRFKADKIEVIFEPKDAKYIFAIAIGANGDIYLGTGPEGKVYKLDSFGKNPQLIYDSTDKNILSLAIGEGGLVFAGSDSRGLIYKIDPKSKTATVLYDSDQDEITALALLDQGHLYAAATSAKITKAEKDFAAQVSLAGPEKSEGGLKLKIANTKKRPDDEKISKKLLQIKPPVSITASHIYKISKEGFVTDIFSKTAVLFSLAVQKQKLLVGAGNSAQFFSIDLETEEEAIIYEDKQASQITAVAAAGDDTYLGTSNPAKLIKLGEDFALEGTYSSELIDAGQPAKWGKLQIEADVPEGCRVLAASRSGNVKDVNDPTFSAWTEASEITEPIQLRCPPGRFCQYKLILQSKDGDKSPIVREVAVAHTVPNLAPRVKEVGAKRIEAAGKKGVFKIGYKVEDDNKDKLIYKIDFRKTSRSGWIKIEDKIQENSFEWDGKTVEDGRYEIRVTASDERSNTAETYLTGTRVSEPVVVDNTGPNIGKYSMAKKNKKNTLKLQVIDKLSAIGQLQYTVDSNSDWISTIPDDSVYDTTTEDFTIVTEKLEAGEHIITIKASDDVGNTTYKTFEVEIAANNK